MSKVAPVTSELRDELRPDSDHSDEKRDRGQRGCFFNKCLQHDSLPHKNIRGTLFLFCSGSQERPQARTVEP
jgi:hypothetical protein